MSFPAPGAAGLPPRSARRLVRRAMLAAQPVLRHTRLTVHVGRALERRRAGAPLTPDPATGPDGLPVPPPALRVANINTPDLATFFEYGERTEAAIAASAERHGLPMADVGRLLDFGCGCGRVLRRWGTYPGLEVWGSDLSAPATAWIEANLPFAGARPNALAPPLEHPDGHFGLIYAISVFTHMPEDLGAAWLAELRRLLRPGGLLLVTLNGSSWLPYLTRTERAAFARGEFVVQFAEAAGENICAAYHPAAHVRRMAADFEVLEFSPPEEHGFVPQDLWVLRRPG